MPDNMTVSRAALRLALSENRDEEHRIKEELARGQIKAVAADLGARFPEAISLAIERAIVAAKREGVIRDEHPHVGAVAGATREALSHISTKALGSNVGGKVAVARSGEHLAVGVFFGVGLVHLDDVAVAVAHRAVPA